MPLDAQGLAAVVAGTLADYDARAEAFRAGTWDHDVSQNIAALLGAIRGPAPWTILDFGCGPGRDLIDFTRRGHRAIGLDGSIALARMARAASGCDVLQQDFLALELPAAHFDGVFANATLQHVPTQVLPRVLSELHAALKPDGVLFASIPHGDGREGWNRERYSAYHAPAAWDAFCTEAGFAKADSFFRPTGMPREQQPWYASVWRKAG
ncbi:MAG: methyltransferase domain-containing protein [Betaproteobacteria bacterium]|nr:methyltransferase domain-containing protein [Betaproteobacteria bacterium]